MDTITLAIIIIGSSLTTALIFAATVLSVKWWKMIVIHKAKKSRQSRQERQQSEAIKKPTSNDVIIKSKYQTLIQLKETAGWNKLINKRVKTCEMVDIGRVSDINDQFMTVIHSTTQQEYIIPTYYIREYDQEKILIDTSIRYLYHYKGEGKLQH